MVKRGHFYSFSTIKKIIVTKIRTIKDILVDGFLALISDDMKNLKFCTYGILDLGNVYFEGAFSAMIERLCSHSFSFAM